MNTARLILFLAAILSLVGGYGMRTFRSSPPIDERVYLKEIAPDALFSAKQGNPPAYQGHDGTIAFNTYDVAPSIRGYAGPIKVMLALGRDGRITGLKIIEHRETKNYVHYLEMPEYLSQFIGKHAGDPFEVDKDIDSITRATVSVKALAETVREASRTVSIKTLGMNIPAREGKAKDEIVWLWYALLFALAFAAYLLTRRSKTFLHLRDASLFAGIMVIGLYLSSPFSVLHVFNLLLLRPSSEVLWYVIVLSALLSVIIAGRFYCGWLCPFGALSEFIGRMPVRKWNIPDDVDTTWRILKYILLGVIVTLVFASARVDCGNYEAYVTLFSFHGNVFAWSLTAITLIANVRIKRFWCRYLCPLAALTGLLSREAKGYPGSGDCPMANKPYPLISECIRCNRCYTK